MVLTDYAENKIYDALLRGQARLLPGISACAPICVAMRRPVQSLLAALMHASPLQPI